MTHMQFFFQAIHDFKHLASLGNNIDNASFGALADSCLAILEVGLVGNRAIKAHFWYVCTALEAAFPLLLGPNLGAIRRQHEGQEPEQLAKAWILLALSNGTLCETIGKLSTQPQIFSAYRRNAPLREGKSAAEIVSALRSIQELGVFGARAASRKPAATVNEGQNAQISDNTALQPSNVSPQGPTIEQVDKSDSPDQNIPEEAPANVFGRLRKQVADNFPARLIPPIRLGSAQAQPAAGSSPRLVTVHFECSKDEVVTVRLRVIATESEQKPTIYTGLTTRAHDLLVGAASTGAHLPADSVQWLKSAATYIPAMPKSMPGIPFRSAEPSAQLTAAPAKENPSLEIKQSQERVVQDSTSNQNESNSDSAHLTSNDRGVARELLTGSGKSPKDSRRDGVDNPSAQGEEGVQGSVQSDLPPPQGIDILQSCGAESQMNQGAKASHEQNGTEANAEDSAGALLQGNTQGWGMWTYFRPAALQGGLSKSVKPDKEDHQNPALPVAQASNQTSSPDNVRQEGLELGEKLMGFAQHLLEVSLVEEKPLPPTDKRVDQLRSVAQFLEHGLLPEDFGTWIWASGRSSKPRDRALPVLHELDKTNQEDPLSPAANDQCVSDWIQKKMLNGQLGQKLLALHRNTALLQRFYSGAALIRQPECGRILGLLVSLDGTKFSTASPEQTGGLDAKDRTAGIWSSMTQYLRPLSHTETPLTSAAPNASKPSLTKKRRRTPRSVEIGSSATALQSAESASPLGFHTPTSHGLLSPLSSTELSAEPLSPKTAAFLRSLRNLAPELYAEQDNQLDAYQAPNCFSPQFLSEVLAELPHIEVAESGQITQTGSSHDIGIAPSLTVTKSVLAASSRQGPDHADSAAAQLCTKTDSNAKPEVEENLGQQCQAVDPDGREAAGIRTLNQQSAETGLPDLVETLLLESGAGTGAPNVLRDGSAEEHAEVQQSHIERLIETSGVQRLELNATENSLGGDTPKSPGLDSLTDDTQDSPSESWTHSRAAPSTDKTADNTTSQPHCEADRTESEDQLHVDEKELPSGGQPVQDVALQERAELPENAVDTQELATSNDVHSSDRVFQVGSRIKLITTEHALLPDDQTLDEQDHICPGCGNTLNPVDSKKSGSKNSKAGRRCYYTGWFYCSDCHSNQTSIIPALVLGSWDFSRKPVCNMAKEFLLSIHEQALLSNAAFKPGLLDEVALLAKAQQHREKAAKALASAQGISPEARNKVERFLSSLGMHRHLLEDAEMWSIQDLLEISKGNSSELLKWLEKGERKSCSIATSALLGAKPK